MRNEGRSWGLVLAAVAGTVLCATSARAASIAVSCDGGQTIADALAALDFTGPNSITVSGTCHESVSIGNRDRLALEGNDATIVGAAADTPVINVGGSHGITVSGFTLTGGSSGLRVARASEVVASHITATGNAVGIVVESSFLRLDGAISVTGNSANGISTGSARIFLSSGEGPNLISNNGGNGVSLSDGSKGNFTGDTAIQNNGGAGVLVFHTSFIFLIGAVVDSNGGTGVNVQETSHGELASDTISNNGASTSGGGIRVADNSDLYTDGAVTVTNNVGVGVQAEFAGQFSSLGGNTVSGNSGDGVRVHRLALGHFFAPDVISGNGGDALTCDKSSLVVGDLTGVSKVKCSNTVAP